MARQEGAYDRTVGRFWKNTALQTARSRAVQKGKKCGKILRLAISSNAT